MFSYIELILSFMRINQLALALTTFVAGAQNSSPQKVVFSYGN